MDLTFARLRAEYLNEVLEIEKLSFPQPWTRGMFEREISLPISHFFVAQIENRVIGYGGFWQVEDEAHVTNLAVHPDARAKGFGRQILHYLIREIAAHRGTAGIFLEVRRSNLCALKLYESAGFKTVGIRPRYYQTEDAVLMEKTLTTGSDGQP